MTKFRTKAAQILGYFWGYFEQSHIVSNNWCVYFLYNCWKKRLLNSNTLAATDNISIHFGALEMKNKIEPWSLVLFVFKYQQQRSNLFSSGNLQTGFGVHDSANFFFNLKFDILSSLVWEKCKRFCRSIYFCKWEEAKSKCYVIRLTSI